VSNIELQQREIKKFGEDKQLSKQSMFEKKYRLVAEMDDEVC
jgi:hypothetical protein